MGCSCCPSTSVNQPKDRPSDAAPPMNAPLVDAEIISPSRLRDTPSSSKAMAEAAGTSRPTMPEQDSSVNEEVSQDMGCQDGCCGSAPVEAANEEVDNNCDLSDFSIKSQSVLSQDEEPGPKSTTGQAACGGGCCDSQPTETVSQSDVSPREQTKGVDGLEGSLVAKCDDKRDCADNSESCSSTLPPTTSALTELKAPDCCSGVPSPCCDESCLDRLALRECDTYPGVHRAESTRSARSSESGSGKGDSRTRKPCETHQRSVRDQYAARLATLGCICRALLALGKESCCPPRGTRLPKRETSPRQSFSKDRSCAPDDSCCGKGISTVRGTDAKPRSRGACGSEKRVAPQCRSELSCGPKSASSGHKVPRPCPSKSMIQSNSGELGLSNKACSKDVSQPSGSVAETPDLEKQITGIEHVILSVSGMTCTGCETKLNRNLSTISGVKNLKTSLILSRAEFDLDLNLASVKHVLKHLERTTEFQFESITSSGSSINVTVSDISTFENQPLPEGVKEICPDRNDELRVSFDPKVVGPRDLIEGHWSGVASLAPCRDDPGLVVGRKHVRHVGYVTLLSIMLTIPVLVLSWAPIPEHEIRYSSVSLGLATLVQVLIAGPFYPKALKALIFSRVIEMDLLIVLSTSAAYIFSLASFGYLVTGKPLATGQFFETSTLLVTLIMVGRYVAALARQKAVESISIKSLQSQNSVLVEDPTSFEGREIDVRLLQYGDIFLVAPDTRIPTDGTVITGSSEVNESMLTGESCPVEKHPQSRVIAGTINVSGTLLVRVIRLPGDNTITAIAAMVDEAKLTKPKMQELADKVASYFVPVIVALAIVTFVVWIAVGIAGQGETGSEAAVQSITYAITVLIVSCPCAIGLAVPMVVLFASGLAAERGVIFKSAHAIEVAYKTSHVVFDKTGTLTQGRLSVVVENHREDSQSRLPLLLGLIGNNKHPVSVAVASHLVSKGVVATKVPSARSLTGRGMEGEIGGQVVQGGNARWLNVQNHALVQPVLLRGYTAFCFAIDGEVCAVFGLEDSFRDDAAETVAALSRMGVSVHMVSGDDAQPVQKAASILGIPEENVHAHSSPSDKQSYINNLLGASSETKEQPVVMFCGDGTNDAVALAQATIGIHMNSGSDIAQAAADVVLMRPALSGVLTVINTSKVSVRRIKFNFGWSFVYNTFAILLAAGAFVKARIPPEYAGLGELVSVLPVIVAAVLLRWSKI